MLLKCAIIYKHNLAPFSQHGLNHFIDGIIYYAWKRSVACWCNVHTAFIGYCRIMKVLFHYQCPATSFIRQPPYFADCRNIFLRSYRYIQVLKHLMTRRG